MNHTTKGIVIVAAIASMLVVGLNMIPLSQNTYASSSRHSEFKKTADENKNSKSGENNLNQVDTTYRSPGSKTSNVAVQENGKGNTATAFTDLSSNVEQNQTTMAQPQSSHDSDKKDRSFPVTVNVVPNFKNENTNSVVGNTSSAADASNANTLSNRNAQNQTDGQNACLIAGECTASSHETETG
ncbi:MAG: hypothetical protein JO297_16645 [Nitrososphaeraceae archaeon]|nr:hypothetical protein [Nitrososphaeraceae archaeon]